MEQKDTEQKRKHKLSSFADKRQRDEHGHFILAQEQKENTETKAKPSAEKSNPLGNFLHQQTSFKKATDNDTLVDVRVNNPLKKITQLLEDIKKQKAFAFTIKGSLGIAGIAVLLTTVGIFGGTKAFCSKGMQSHVGEIRILSIPEQSNNQFLLSRVWHLIIGQPISDSPLSRIVLIESNHNIYHLAGITQKERKLIQNIPYVVTGEVDSCTQTITVNDPQAIEAY